MSLENIMTFDELDDASSSEEEGDAAVGDDHYEPGSLGRNHTSPRATAAPGHASPSSSPTITQSDQGTAITTNEHGTQLVLSDESAQGYEPTDEEVKAYALDYLEMDIQADNDLLYIAREALKAPVPHPWKACQDAESGDVYFFNFQTGESRWDHPSDEKFKRLYRRAKAKKEGRAVSPDSEDAMSNQEGEDETDEEDESMAASNEDEDGDGRDAYADDFEDDEVELNSSRNSGRGQREGRPMSGRGARPTTRSGGARNPLVSGTMTGRGGRDTRDGNGLSEDECNSSRSDMDLSGDDFEIDLEQSLGKEPPIVGKQPVLVRDALVDKAIMPQRSPSSAPHHGARSNRHSDSDVDSDSDADLPDDRRNRRNVSTRANEPGSVGMLSRSEQARMAPGSERVNVDSVKREMNTELQHIKEEMEESLQQEIALITRAHTAKLNELKEKNKNEEETAIQEANDAFDQALRDTKAAHDNALKDLKASQEKGIAAAREEHQQALDVEASRHKAEIAKLQKENAAAISNVKEGHEKLMAKLKEKLAGDRVATETELNAKRSDAEAKLSEEMEAARKEKLDALQTELDEARAEKEKSNLKVLDDLMTTFEKEKAKAQKELEDLKSAHDKEKKDAIAANNAALEQLRKKLTSESEKEQEQIRAAGEAKIKQLHAEIQELQDECDQQIETLQAELKRLEQEKEEKAGKLKEDIALLEKKQGSVDADLQGISEKITAEEDALQNVKNTLAAQQEQLDTAVGKLKEEKAKLERLETEKSAVAESVAAMGASQTTLAADIARLEEQRSDLEAEFAARKAKFDELEALSQKKEELQREIEELEEEAKQRSKRPFGAEASLFSQGGMYGDLLAPTRSTHQPRRKEKAGKSRKHAAQRHAQAGAKTGEVSVADGDVAAMRKDTDGNAAVDDEHEDGDDDEADCDSTEEDGSQQRGELLHELMTRGQAPLSEDDVELGRVRRFLNRQRANMDAHRRLVEGLESGLDRENLTGLSNDEIMHRLKQYLEADMAARANEERVAYAGNNLYRVDDDAVPLGESRKIDSTFSPDILLKSVLGPDAEVVDSAGSRSDQVHVPPTFATGTVPLRMRTGYNANPSNPLTRDFVGEHNKFASSVRRERGRKQPRQVSIPLAPAPSFNAAPKQRHRQPQSQLQGKRRVQSTVREPVSLSRQHQAHQAPPYQLPASALTQLPASKVTTSSIPGASRPDSFRAVGARVGGGYQTGVRPLGPMRLSLDGSWRNITIDNQPTMEFMSSDSA